MPARQRVVRNYVTKAGRQPFEEWLRKLKDAKTRAIIRTRINRLRLGNFGDTKSVGAGVNELRIHHGPGYRVYFAESGTTLVILLCGGSKRTQGGDIRRAKDFWQELRSRDE